MKKGSDGYKEIILNLFALNKTDNTFHYNSFSDLLTRVKETIINTTYLVMLSLAIPLLISSFGVASDPLWIIIIRIVTFSLNLFVFLRIGSISLETKSLIIISSLFINGVAGYISNGFYSLGGLFFLTGTVMTILVYGEKRTNYLIMSLMIIYFLIAFLFSERTLSIHYNATNDAFSPSIWLARGLALLFFLFIATKSIAILLNFLKDFIKKLEVSNNTLSETNSKLIKSEKVIQEKYEELETSQRRLKESEEYNKTLFKSSYTPLVVIELTNYTFIDANDAAVKIYGFNSIDEIIGLSPYQVSAEYQYNSERSKDLAPKIIQEAYEKGMLEFEWRHLRPDGTEWDASVQLMLFTIQDRQFMQFSLKDITQDKWAQNEIKKLNLELIELNKELEYRVAVRTEELQRALEQLRTSNIELQALNEQVMEDSNRILLLNESLMTSQKMLEQTLATKDKFFSIVSHDLRNPLSAFAMNAEMLVHYFDKFDPITIKTVVQKIHKNSMELMDFLDNLLNWARAQSGGLNFSYENINLKKAITDSVNLLKTNADAKMIDIKLHTDSVIFAWADSNMLGNILRNLITNSIKFTASGGLIEIGILDYDIETMPFTDEFKDMCCIYVQDNGIGMSKSELSDIFTLKTQHTRQGTAGETGGGLGLVLSKEFVERNGGKIWIESEEGKGTIVRFSLKKSAY